MTARLYEIFNSFQTGVLDPTFLMRTETAAYNNGLQQGRNIQLLNAGGWMRRPGSTYLNTINDAARVFTFIFDSDEAYIVAIYNGNIRIYDTTGTQVASLTGSSAPWNAAEVQEIYVTQLFDTMVICQGDNETRVLRRNTASSFSCTALSTWFETDLLGNNTYQPYYKYEDADVTIKASATSGSGVTITASAGIFTPSHVGTTIRWFETEIQITARTSATVVTGTILGTLQGEYLEDPMRATDGSGTVEVTHALHGFPNGSSVTISGATGFAGLTTAQLNGTFTITVVDDNRYTFASGGTATSSADGGGPSVKFTGANLNTRRWDEQAWSDVRGWPRSCLFYEGRLWLASTLTDPSAIWASQLNRFFNFNLGDGLPTDSIQVTIGSEQQVAEIIHLFAEKDLTIFTTTGEYYAPKPQDSTLTPETFRLVKQTPYGASSAVPINFDGATLFVQEGTSSVREFLYIDVNQSYTAASVSYLSNHLLSNPVQIAGVHGTTSRPEQYAYFCNDDGTMAVFLSSRSEKVAGWTWFDTNYNGGSGSFKQVVTIGRDVFVVVLRGSAYYLEKFDGDDTILLDCATNYTDATPKTVWTVDSIYSGKTVDVMSNNYYLGQYTCSGTTLTLDDAVDDIHVGWAPTLEVETVPPRVELPTGTRIGITRRIAQATVHFNNTLNCVVDNKPLIVRDVGDDLSVAPTPFTGKRKFAKLGWSKDPTLSFTQTAPQKCRVLGVVQKVLVT